MSNDRNTTFRALHQKGKPFILANVWDIGSARMMQAMGAEAIGTSSAAHAFTLGRPDMGHVTRDEALAHAADLISAVRVPVSGDFENGFGDDPDTCAETVRLAAEVGLSGISIEDTSLPGTTPYSRELAIERIRAASAAARALPNDFVLVARADGVMNKQYDLNEAMARLKGYELAGADCLYVPMPGTIEDQQKICASTSLPVNALAAGAFTKHTLDDFARINVARISVGSAIARMTHKAIHDAGVCMFHEGQFSLLDNNISGSRIDSILSE